MARTEITYGPTDRPTTVPVERGDIITVHTATGSITGPFVSLSAAKGVRLNVDGKYLTRKLAAIEGIEFAAAEESDEELAASAAADAPADAPADVQDADVAAELEQVAEFTGITSHPEGNDCGRGRVHPGVCSPVPVPVHDGDTSVAPRHDGDTSRPTVGISEVLTAVREELTGSAEPSPEGDVTVAEVAAEVTVTDVLDADPIVDGRRLSEMKFPEVMVLAKKYRTPGRGVARIAALREGVAKAIHAETATRIAATAALQG